mmetsp:Transcript_64092/g.143299  ORF Transcript_64092/g.143299 Transcript_64092/m.143299 type:complete len:275 (+) Transcript_64092:428-1252(+)
MPERHGTGMQCGADKGHATTNSSHASSAGTRTWLLHDSATGRNGDMHPTESLCGRSERAGRGRARRPNVGRHREHNGTFGGPTPTGWEDAEKIEVTKRKSLAGMGERAWKGGRAQVYATHKQGGMGIRHAYAHTGGATLRIVDRALTSEFGQPHALAVQSSILLTSWRFGWFSTDAARTPLDWRPLGAANQMNSDYLIQAWWKAMETAGLRSRHTGSNAGTGEPLDPTLRIYKATCDGGGPSLWGEERPVFVDLSQIGVVRAADICEERCERER